MNQTEKIDHMIKSLEVVKDEIEYAKKWGRKKSEQGNNFYSYSGYGNTHRHPSGTTIRESLRMVGRMANQVANEVSLTNYCSELFKK